MNVEGTDMYPSSEGRRAAARATTELLQDKDILLQEMQHRVANSLQIIASILTLKARTMQSEGSRLHGPGLEREDACDDLEAVGDTVLHLLEQNIFVLQQLCRRPCRGAPAFTRRVHVGPLHIHQMAG